MEVFYLDAFKKSVKTLAKRYKSFKNDLVTFLDTLESNQVQSSAFGNDLYKVRIKNSDNNKGKVLGIE